MVSFELEFLMPPGCLLICSFEKTHVKVKEFAHHSCVLQNGYSDSLAEPRPQASQQPPFYMDFFLSNTFKG